VTKSENIGSSLVFMTLLYHLIPSVQIYSCGFDKVIVPSKRIIDSNMKAS
jgi:hypothetical protein